MVRFFGVASPNCPLTKLAEFPPRPILFTGLARWERRALVVAPLSLLCLEKGLEFLCDWSIDAIDAWTEGGIGDCNSRAFSMARVLAGKSLGSN